MTGIGDNAAKQAIRRVVRAVEDIEAQIADLNTDKSEFYKEAKGNGLDVAVIRAVVAERRKRTKDPEGHAERSALFDVYMDALADDGPGIATRAPAREPEPDPPVLAPRLPVVPPVATILPTTPNVGDPGDIPSFLDRRGRA